MSEQLRQLISLFAGVLIVTGICLLAPSGHFSPQGIMLPAKQTLSPVAPDSVRVFNTVPSSYTYQRLGIVSVERQLTLGQEERDVKSIVKKAQTLAATVGANAVIVGPEGYFAHPPVGSVPLSQNHWVYRGLAIKINASLIPFSPGIEIPSN